ncbi:putative amidase signature domain-containing protein [Septoria linicola]|nr:putative amidase signature domain-containing protein [Septoria linicola]
MEDVAKTLRASSQGIEVIEINASPILKRTLKTFNGIVSIDGANAWFDHLEQTGEPLSPWLQGRLTRRPGKSTDAVRELQAQKSELQTEFLKVWQENGGYWLAHDTAKNKAGRTLDVLIMPVAPHPILPIDRWNTVNYTASLNLLDLPTGLLPVRTTVPEDLKGDVPSSAPLNAWDKVNREHWTKVDRNVYLGSPLSVQVITPRLMERKLIEAMAVLDRALEPLRHETGQISSRL